MALHLHRAPGALELADALGELLATPLPDPFAEEVVAVPAKGVERWLAQRLSHRLGVGSRGGDGVCAGVRFLNPHSLASLVLGIDRQDPWHPDRLVWPLLSVIDESLGEPWCATLAAHLGHGLEGEEGTLRAGRRYSVARRLAGLFAGYAAQRPSMVAAWRVGDDSDGTGHPLDDDLLWQPELWRRVLGRVDAVPPDLRVEQTVARIRSGDDGLDLPGRLSLFGHTRLPLAELSVVEALAERREVHLWLPQASPRLWGDLAPVVADGPVPRAEDGSAAYVGHPLLATLGRDAREVQRTLALARDVVDHPPADDGPDRADLLGWLQHDLRSGRAPDADTVAGRVREPGDQSVQVHACHGMGREVEVLRELLVGILADRPDIEPRDILVMCPDIEAYAPLLQAAFGLGGLFADPVAGHPAHRLRVRLADRGPIHTNALLGVAAQLLTLAESRVSLTEVLDLARMPVVSRRFGFDDDDLDTIAEWGRAAAVRWGLGSEHLETYRLGQFPQNTWAAGLDRLIAGLAVDGVEVSGVGDALALVSLDSGDLDLAGRLTELVLRLKATLGRLGGARPATEWTDALREGVLDLADPSATDPAELSLFTRELSSIADGAGETALLRLPDVRALLHTGLSARPTRASFRTGTLTVCTLVPMRAVPHKVVVLMGLDDGTFPRTTVPDGDDALARRPLTGERDTRSEDRQLLLDAIMSAQEQLVVIYSGADEHTGAERPPAVPLGELIDSLAVTATGGPDIVMRHPLQVFDERNFTAAEGDPPVSFDLAALAGARAALGERHSDDAFGQPLDPAGLSEVSVDELVEFVKDPYRAHLSRRLGIRLPEVPETGRDAIPLEPSGLEKWAIGDRVARALVAGASTDDVVQAELRRGTLPPGGLAYVVLGDILKISGRVAAAAMTHLGGPRRAVDLDIDLPGGIRLTGTVAGTVDGCTLHYGYSSLAPKNLLPVWVRYLALQAAEPTTQWQGVVIGRDRQRVARVRYAGVTPERAREILSELVDLYRRGMDEPVPMPPGTAEAFARNRGRGEEDALDAAAKKWASGYRFPGENAQPAAQRIHGGEVGIEVLTEPARDDERWSPDEPTRLGQYAVRLWGPVLEFERKERV
ncbi:exodeoxyribonuclease V subunit gamma [Actinomycetota bacterium]